MHEYHLLTVLVLITTLFTFLNHRFLKWPPTIAVMAFSLLISSIALLLDGYIPALTTTIKSYVLSLDFSAIVMEILLGFLLFGAAFQMDGPFFKRHMKIIASMAVFGTIISTVLVGIFMYYLLILVHLPMSFLNCLIFGAIISPTDPIAAIGIMKKLKMPQVLELKITGESLINDGVAIVIFITLTGIAMSGAQENVVGNALLLFLQEAGGGVLFGFVIGWIALLLLRKTDNYKVEILITLSIVMGGYPLASMLHISSPIAMVVAGLMCSSKGREDYNHISHSDVYTFWELVEELMNVILFLVIGLEVFIVRINPTILLTGFLAIIVVLFCRYISLLPVYAVFRKKFERHAVKIITWAGLRGAVSIALVLSLPAQLNRSEFLSITYIIAVFSIIVQGLTIKPLAKKLGYRSA